MRTDLIGFSVFGVAQTTAVLPVELSLFEDKAEEQCNLLHWQTEINNAHFVVLRSQDGINFEEIEIAEGTVNSDSQHYYEFYDCAPHYEDYYR
ncbi:MAG: hypothetical protein ACI8Q1_001830 [Parvicella sp.]|jgi:hypothetical protein